MFSSFAETCNKLNTMASGVIGNWSRIGDNVLPEITDYSAIGYNGHLSPLGGFEAINKTAVKESRNGYLKLLGDHIFLPVLPGTTNHDFKLQIEATFPVDTDTNCAVLAIELRWMSGIVLEQFTDHQFRYFIFSYQRNNGTKLSNGTMIKIPMNGNQNKPWLLEIEVIGKYLSISISYPTIESQNAKEKRKMVLRVKQRIFGLWLATRIPNLIEQGKIPVGCFFDIKDVTLSRTFVDLQFLS